MGEPHLLMFPSLRKRLLLCIMTQWQMRLRTLPTRFGRGVIDLLPRFFASKGHGDWLVVGLLHRALPQHVLKRLAEGVTDRADVLQPVLHLQSRVAYSVQTCMVDCLAQNSSPKLAE
jgi:hypothetical protein